ERRPRGAGGWLDLAGAWTALRVGDRLLEAGGPGRRMDGGPAGVGQSGAAVKRIRCRWRPGRGATTRVELGG
ncbi:MAG: hypothetical protein ACLFV3_05420, partial [Phycisphaeraceae bacterium]